MSKSLFPSEFIFICGVSRKPTLIFCTWISSCSAPVVGKITPNLLNCFDTFVKNQLTILV